MSYVSAGLLAAAAVSLGRAIQINDGFYSARALVWLSAAFFCLLAALVPPPRASTGTRQSWLPTTVLAAGLTWQYATLMTARPAMYIDFQQPADAPMFFYLLIGAAVLTLGVLIGGRRPRQLAFTLVLVLHFALGVWMIQASPNPRIDVVTVHREALNALAHGRSPYSITFENIYGHEAFYAPEKAEGGRVLFGLPYPPLSLLLASPGAWLAGDYRYAALAGLTLAGAFIAWIGWRRGRARVERQACLAALVLLFTPRVFFQVEQGWTEPFVVFLMALMLATANHQRTAPVVGGLLLAVKQYAVLAAPLLPLLWGSTRPWRQLAIALGTAAAVTLPFVLWDPHGFVQSVILLQLDEPFRRDSLSYLSWMARRGWAQPSAWITLAAAAAATALALWRLPRTPAGFAGAVALVSLATFAFGKKAFCNYYFFVIAALAMAVGAADEGIQHEATGDASVRRGIGGHHVEHAGARGDRPDS